MQSPLYHLSLTLETPAANLALDEALGDAAAAGELPGAVLRTWEPADYCVVLGRSSPPSEANEPQCRRDGAAIVRRSSGGQAVVVGPGCLMYSLAMRLGVPEAPPRQVSADPARLGRASGSRGNSDARHALNGPKQIHDWVLERLARALNPLAAGVIRCGVSDLARAMTDQPPKKFSGNSLRLRREALLYHGTLLYDFDLERVERWLGPPARQPAYRAGRPHGEFVGNFPASRAAILAALAAAWGAATPYRADWPRERVGQLLQTRRGAG